jgi:hypothetical protein
MFENYELDDIEVEIVDAFISAFVDRDPVAMRELIYQLTDFMDELNEEERPELNS